MKIFIYYCLGIGLEMGVKHTLQEPSLYHSLLYPQNLQEDLAHGSCSNIGEWMN